MLNPRKSLFILLLLLAHAALLVHAQDTITLDGDVSDWANTAVPIVNEAVGDAREGHLDFTGGALYRTDSALVLMVEVADPAAAFVQFDLFLIVDGRRFLMSWQPGAVTAHMADITTSFQPLGAASNSRFVMDSGFEALIDLGDLGNPDQARVVNLVAQAGECCDPPDWFPADQIGFSAQVPTHNIPVTLPQLERVSHLGAIHNRVQVDYILRHDMQTVWGAAWSTADNAAYFANWLGGDVVRVREDGTLDPLHLWEQDPSLMTDGPVDVAFTADGTLHFATHSRIFALAEDNSLIPIPRPEMFPIGAIAFDSNDQLYYAGLQNGMIWRVDANGNHSPFITINGARFKSLAFGVDGTLYAASMNQASLFAIDPNTAQYRTLYSDPNDIGDPIFLALDPDGDIWIRTTALIMQIAPNGTTKGFTFNQQPVTNPPQSYSMDFSTGGGVVFDPQGRLWIGAYDSGVFRLVPAETGAYILNGGNVRSCPSTECDVVGQAAAGVTVSGTGAVDGQLISGSRLWYAITFDGTPAYVHSSLAVPVQDQTNWTRQNLDPGFSFSNMDVASDGTLYGFNINPSPGGALWQVEPTSGEVAVLWTVDDLGAANINKDVGLAFDEANNAVYIGLPQDGIVRYDMATGEVSPYAAGYAREMVVASDGNLYAALGDWFQPKQLVRITGQNAVEPVLSATDGVPLGLADTPLSVAPDGGLFLLNPQAGAVYHITLDGQTTRAADMPEAAGNFPPVMAVDPDGGIYALAHADYNLWYYPPDGSERVSLAQGFADPLSAVASPAGNAVYVCESGALNRFTWR